MQLTPEAFDRARKFLTERARPVDRALFEHDFAAGGAAALHAALQPFRNDDGGFGHGLEPDLRMPGSSTLATSQGLVHLRAVDTPASHEMVRGAVGWLVENFDRELSGWRSVSQEGERHPHAPHWGWSLHESGKTWPIGVLPRAEVLASLFDYASEVPGGFLEPLAERFIADLPALTEKVGADALSACDGLCRSAATPAAVRDACRTWMLGVGPKLVDRDPQKWSGYCAKPLKLAPRPDSMLAEALADDVARNLDYEIEHQADDGSWGPNWTWGDNNSDGWENACLEWHGTLTREALEKLRAWGRLSD
jgi:hypothetical protein